jgi:hypothetical protein
MLITTALAASGEQIMALDEDALASVVGGDGWKEWLAKKIGELLFDCIAGGLDDLIDAAEEGYEDAR